MRLVHRPPPNPVLRSSRCSQGVMYKLNRQIPAIATATTCKSAGHRATRDVQCAKFARLLPGGTSPPASPPRRPAWSGGTVGEAVWVHPEQGDAAGVLGGVIGRVRGPLPGVLRLGRWTRRWAGRFAPCRPSRPRLTSGCQYGSTRSGTARPWPPPGAPRTTATSPRPDAPLFPTAGCR